MKTFWASAPAALLVFCAAPALGQTVDPHAGHAPAPQPAPVGPHAGHAMPEETLVIHEDVRSGVLGGYSMARDASGTSWQPDSSPHTMHGTRAEGSRWTLMRHALLNGVYDWQDGPRGDEKAFIAGMIMGAARYDRGNGDTLNLRAMLSPDPLMGDDGYPLLFAAGESADGATTLVDRQHPHDLFMELSASYAHRIGDSGDQSVFIYAGLPGEPAFGPPAFMHRLAAMDSPEAPITHHWFDSTHITFGVVTAGYIHDRWKIEASRFRGREPDEHRYDIETGELDSTAFRVSWNPTGNLALQVSWADVISPEGLHPDEDEERVSASAIYTRALDNTGWWSTTLAFARKEKDDGDAFDAWLIEAALHPNADWTFFTRAEAIETNELEGHHGPTHDVARLSAGAVRDWRVADHLTLGVGALVQTHRPGAALEAAYGDNPAGAMAFVRLKID